MAELAGQGRMNPDRDHVATAMHEFLGAVGRPPRPVQPELANDIRYDGLVCVWTDRDPSTPLADLDHRDRDGRHGLGHRREIEQRVLVDRGPGVGHTTHGSGDVPEDLVPRISDGHSGR